MAVSTNEVTLGDAGRNRFDPQERSTWRSGMRYAIRAANQLPGRGPLMWMMPLHLHVKLKSDYDIYGQCHKKTCLCHKKTCLNGSMGFSMK